MVHKKRKIIPNIVDTGFAATPKGNSRTPLGPITSLACFFSSPQLVILRGFKFKSTKGWGLSHIVSLPCNFHIVKHSINLQHITRVAGMIFSSDFVEFLGFFFSFFFGFDVFFLYFL